VIVTTYAAGPESADHLDLSISLERLVALVPPARPEPGHQPDHRIDAHTLDQNGPHRLSELAVREGVSQPAMTSLVSRLERDGYAKRRPDPADARVVVVHLTKGRRPTGPGTPRGPEPPAG